MINDTNNAVVIVGAGLAGVTAATGLRRRGFAGPILLINEEQQLPYDRPPLSKEVLFGERSVQDIALHDAAFYDQQAISVIPARVRGIDRERRTLTLDNGDALRYKHLVLATGSRPRPLPLPAGRQVPTRLFYLRDLRDAVALRAHLLRDRHLLVVGAGFIGLEVAAAARRLGCRVTVLEAGRRVLERAAPEQVAAFIQAVHQDNGVEFRFGALVQDVSDDERGVAVHLAGGEVLAADAMLVGIGALPNDDLALAAGLPCKNGIIVDEHCRTSDPHVFAIGDVASGFHPFMSRHVRLEHWESARHAGELAAAAICGEPAANDSVPWVWSDQYQLNLQFLGWSDPRAHTLVRGDKGTGNWSVIAVLDQRVIGAVLINSGRERRPLERLIRSGIPVDAARLADAGVALKQWVPA
jgi:NADPH-dependent 2,4-dienoyl-CoA reductase/sulfur reductase-like enzyme